MLWAQKEVDPMNIMTKTILGLILTLSATFSIACDYPASPKDLPDGTTATKDEMLAGVKVIAGYQEEMATYLACIEADEIVAAQAQESDDEDGKKQRKSMFDKKYNAAVDEQTKTVEEFNAQIRAFKAR